MSKATCERCDGGVLLMLLQYAHLHHVVKQQPQVCVPFHLVMNIRFSNSPFFFRFSWFWSTRRNEDKAQPYRWSCPPLPSVFMSGTVEEYSCTRVVRYWPPRSSLTAVALGDGSQTLTVLENILRIIELYTCSEKICILVMVVFASIACWLNISYSIYIYTSVYVICCYLLQEEVTELHSKVDELEGFCTEALDELDGARAEISKLKRGSAWSFDSMIDQLFGGIKDWRLYFFGGWSTANTFLVVMIQVGRNLLRSVYPVEFL